MLKVARKSSTDPVQEKLRQSKQDWNKEVSTFINDLINFKKTMNGAPSKFFQEKSSIKDPIPADPATIIGVLADDFQQIAQKGNSIIKDQIEYSKVRKKRQMKQMNLPFPDNSTPPASSSGPDLSQQLSLPLSASSNNNELVKLAESLESKYSLEKEASNVITRFFAKLLNPTIGFSEAARVRKYRMALLDNCIKTYRQLGKFQVEVVKSSKESINSSNTKLHEAWNTWRLVYTGFSTYKQNMPAKIPDSGGNIAPPKELVETKKEEEKEKKKEETAEKSLQQEVAKENVPAPVEQVSPAPDTSLVAAKAIVEDFKKVGFGSKFPPEDKIHFSQLGAVVSKFFMAPNNRKIDFVNLLTEEYSKLLATLTAKYGPASTLAELASKLDLGNNASDHLEVVAQAFLKKWIGKTRHQLSMFDDTSSYRLDAFKMAEEIRKTIDKIMDSLEKEMNVDQLDELVREVNAKMTSLRSMMRSLHMSMPHSKKNNPAQSESMFDNWW